MSLGLDRLRTPLAFLGVNTHGIAVAFGVALPRLRCMSRRAIRDGVMESAVESMNRIDPLPEKIIFASAVKS